MTLTSRARVALAVAMTQTMMLGTSAFGQTLADRVPADSMVYFGWRGTADPGPGYTGSRWEAALKESNFGKFVDDTLPAAASAVARKWPEQGTLWQSLVNVTRQAIKRPTAGFFSFDERPTGGLFCRAAEDAAVLSASYQHIADSLPRALRARVVESPGEVGMVFGYAADDVVPGGLDADPAFKNALKQVVGEPTGVLYVNAKKLRELSARMGAQNAPADTLGRYTRFMDASGLDGVNGLIWACGFDGRDWAIDAFLDAPSPRKGLLAVSKESAIDPALVKRIPASANTARVFHLNPAGLLNDTREIASAVDPEARDMLEKIVGASKLAVGRDLTADLLPSLGTQWAAYTSSDVGGTGTAGLVLVNRLKNPAKAKQAMVSLSLFLSNSGLNLVPDKRITLAGRMTKVGDLQVYYAATPLVSPAWTIKDDCLYLGFYPQPVIEAARYSGASIDTVPAFAELMKPRDGTNVTALAIAYTDVLRTIDDGYTAALAGSRLLFGFGDLYLAPSPEPLLPTLPALRAQATAATTSMWADDAGLHLRARSPFPGAETMATFQVLDLSSAPMALSILLPSLNRAREQAQRVKSMSNLRQMGLAAVMCANEDGNGRFPADFGEMMRRQEIGADVFLNPRHQGHALPPVPPGEDARNVYAAWAAEQSDYIYAGRGKRMTDGADGILAYEKPQALTDGISVLFADGHVEFVTFDQIDAVFTKAGLAAPER